MTRLAQRLTVVLLGIIAGVVSQPVHGATGLTDEELKTVNAEFDRAIQRYDDWLSRMYELDADQKDQVHKHMLELKQAQLDWGPAAEAEMNTLSKELRYYIEQARQGKTLDKQKVQELQDRMTSVVQKAPLSMNTVIAESEKFMTPEQVQAGRQRIADYNARISEMQERQKAMLPEMPPNDIDVLKPYWKSDPSAGIPQVLPPASTQPVAETPKPKPAPIVTSAPASAPASAPTVDPADIGDAWTRFVQSFIDTYQLDSRQQPQCWQIHSELEKRAEEYRAAHRADYEAVSRIESKDLVARELKDLNKPIVDLFGELKDRLNGIPTDDQRKVAENAKSAAPKATSSAPTTRPAKAPARPGVKPAPKAPARPASTQPAGK